MCDQSREKTIVLWGNRKRVELTCEGKKVKACGRCTGELLGGLILCCARTGNALMFHGAEGASMHGSSSDV